MVILAMPSKNIKRSRFGLVSHTAQFESIFTKSAQTEERPGARWRANYILPPMKQSKAALWQAFLVQLRGRAGRFYGFDPDYALLGPRGTAAGDGVVNGEGQTGNVLETRGWDISQPALFAVGDQIAYDTTLGRELKMVTQVALSDANGEAALTIEPPIRVPPADGTVIIKTAPSCIMQLEEDEAGWDADELHTYGVTFNAIEVYQ